MLERFLLAWLTLLSLVAFYWRDWFDLDPFRFSEPYLDYLIVVTMFAIGSMLPRDEIEQLARRWPTVLAGTAIQYGSMPLLAYVMARLYRLDDDLMIGMVMVGCVPGAMASNVLTLMARGNVSYSVSLTTLATLLSPLMVPAVLAVALGARVQFPAADVSMKLCWMVVLPVVAGHLLSRRLTGWGEMARRVGSKIASLTILWIVAVVVAVNRDRLAATSTTLVWALLSLNVAGYGAGFAGGLALRLPPAMRRALTLEIGMQNAGLGTVLAFGLFPDREGTTIPTALYTFGCMFTGTILARWWARSEKYDP